MSDYVAWAKAENGRIIRAYGYADSMTLVNLGEPTPEEIEIGFDFLDYARATPDEMKSHEAKLEADRDRQSRLRDEFLALNLPVGSGLGEIDDSSDDLSLESQLARLIPDEDSVMLLASRWSINPIRLYEKVEGSEIGFCGRLPRRN